MARPIVTLENVTKTYRMGEMKVPVLKGISLTVSAGEFVAVMGQSGSGKSTLMNILGCLDTPTSGRYFLDGRDVTGLDSRELAATRNRMLGFVFQQFNLLPRIAALENVELPLLYAGVPSRQRRVRAREALARVGLGSAALDRYPHMFSGGQRQRIAIARALMLAPALVVADEPVAALDVSIQAQVLNLLMDLKDSSGIAYLFITHNLEVVRHIADEVAVMYFGRIVERAAKRTLFEAPRHPYTQVLLAATPTLAPRRTPTPPRGEPPSPLAPPAGCAFHGRCPLAVDRCRVEVPALRQVGETWVACHLAG